MSKAEREKDSPQQRWRRRRTEERRLVPVIAVGCFGLRERGGVGRRPSSFRQCGAGRARAIAIADDRAVSEHHVLYLLTNFNCRVQFCSITYHSRNMKIIQRFLPAIAIATFVGASSDGSDRLLAKTVAIGDEVCITGFIMDNWCIYTTGGTLLDMPDVITLQNPEKHSFHCLLDVDVCIESGYAVLGEKNATTDRHSVAYQLDDANVVVQAGRALGKKGSSCTTCTGEGDASPEVGYSATVKGTVMKLGDGSDGVSGSPMLTNVTLFDKNVSCVELSAGGDSDASTGGDDEDSDASTGGDDKDSGASLAFEGLHWFGTLLLVAPALLVT